MLLDRSKRYAGVDDEIPRLALSSTWQLLVIALLIVALLVLIFPRKALIASLYEQEVLDELTLSYIQNLYRAEPGNADVAILLAKSQQFELAVVDLESMLSPFISGGEMGASERKRAFCWPMRMEGPLTPLPMRVRAQALWPVPRR